jgi:hypothetical protein
LQVKYVDYTLAVCVPNIFTNASINVHEDIVDAVIDVARAL